MTGNAVSFALGLLPRSHWLGGCCSSTDNALKGLGTMPKMKCRSVIRTREECGVNAYDQWSKAGSYKVTHSMG